MAYKILGTIQKIGNTENITTKQGKTLTRRSLILVQKRYDQNTGEELASNYPELEFSGERCARLDRFNVGDRVQVSFDVVGTKYNDQNGEEKYMTRLRAFELTPFVLNAGQGAQPTQAPAPQQDAQPQSPAPQPQAQGFDQIANDPTTIQKQPSAAPAQPDLSFLNQ